jgi:hypothetical protein
MTDARLPTTTGSIPPESGRASAQKRVGAGVRYLLGEEVREHGLFPSLLRWQGWRLVEEAE